MTPFWLFKSLFHIPSPLKLGFNSKKREKGKPKMDSSAKRKVGAIALIVAGIGAFLVPFLLHGPALQASNTNGGNNGGNTGCTSNCGPGTTRTPPGTHPPPSTNPSTCSSDDKDTDAGSHTSEGKHVAKGHDKHDTSMVSKAHGFMAALAKHNPQHDATHSTKTDNDTVEGHGHHASDHHTEASACADSDDSDDESNDD